MSRLDDIVDILGRSSRGKRLDPEERRGIARALHAVLDRRARVTGLTAVEVLCDRPEHFEGSGRFSAIFRAVLHPADLTEGQQAEMLTDLRVHDHFRDTGETIAHYKAIRQARRKEVAALGRADVAKELATRLKRAGFWKPKKQRYEGVVLVGLAPVPEHQRGKPRRELRQEFLYGIEHANLLTILLGTVASGHLVQFEERWGHRDWRSLSRAERVQVVLDAARGLEYLHGLNIIHRDVKPENVLIRGRKTPRAKLCDYGLIDSDELGEHGVTKTEDGTVVGTILYMAPEQARAETTRLSDVFSLGGLLYAYLTERHPTPIPLGATRHQQSDQVLHRRKKPQDPLQLLPLADKRERTLVGRLSLVIAASLREVPAERYQDVGELAADLERVLAGEDPTAAIERARALKMPLDLYRDSVFSPTPPYPTEEQLAGESVSERDSDAPPAPRRLRRALLLAAVALIAALAAVWALNPDGWGEALVEMARQLVARGARALGR